MHQKPIKVLHVIGTMNRGGAETMIMNYYRNIDRDRIQFDFVENSFLPAAFDEEIESLGGKIFRCPHYNGKNHLNYVKWWKAFIREHGAEYSAVHGHLGSTAAIYLAIAKKAGIYTIAHSHNTHPKSLSSIPYRLYAYPTRYIADFFFACSTDAGVARYGHKVCKTERFKVMKNAIDTDTFAFSQTIRNEMRCRLGIDQKTVIGHIGRFLPQKNHKFLVRVFAEIHEKNADTVLLLVGDGELRLEIERQVQKAGLANSVIFSGVQSNTSDYYQAMDAFVLPSVFEGLGIVAVEAQSSGLPCVISDKVSRECIVSSNLVTIHSLADHPAVWAESVLEKVKQNRTDCSLEVKQHGYDIYEEVKVLQNFYLKIGADGIEK